MRNSVCTKQGSLRLSPHPAQAQAPRGLWRWLLLQVHTARNPETTPGARGSSELGTPRPRAGDRTGV